MIQMTSWKRSDDPVFTVNTQCWWMERSAVIPHPPSESQNFTFEQRFIEFKASKRDIERTKHSSFLWLCVSNLAPMSERQTEATRIQTWLVKKKDWKACMSYIKNCCSSHSWLSSFVNQRLLHSAWTHNCKNMHKRTCFRRKHKAACSKRFQTKWRRPAGTKLAHVWSL